MRIHYIVGFIFFPLWNNSKRFPQYKKTCKVLIDYPTIEEENIKQCVNKAIRSLLYANIDVHSRRLIADFSAYGVKCISKIQYHCANMNLSNKRRYDRLFKKVSYIRGKSTMNYIKRFQNAQDLSVLLGNIYSEDHFMNIFLDNFHQGGKYYSQIVSHQAELRREERFTDQIF